MLFKNNPTPAVAHAGYQESKSESSPKKIDGISFMGEQEDDFQSYASNPNGGAKKKAHQKSSPKKGAPSKKERVVPRSNKRFMPFVYAIIAIIAVIIVIAIVVAIINAPGSNMEKSDTVYIHYQDAEGNWRIAVDGEELEYKFVNEISLEVADNNNFAYISEKLDSGNLKIYILEDEELISSEREIKEVLKKSPLTPCVIYKAADMNGIFCFKGENDDNTVTGNENASDFVIVPDGSAVYFTTPAVAADGTTTIALQQYKGANLKQIALGYIPLKTSAENEYVYVTTPSRRGFAYFDVSDEDEFTFKQIQDITSYIYEDGITAINVDGDQVILATLAPDQTVSSYFYEIGDDAATSIGTGVFKSVHYDPEVLFEDSLLDSYFEVQNFYVDNENTQNPEQGTSQTAPNNVTCFINSKVECVQVAPTTGKFSPDGKYFYYIDAISKSLKRVSLSSKKFDKHENMPPNGEITDFYITQKSDLYVLVKESNKDNVLSLYFVDASTSPSPELLSVKVDVGSVAIAVNTLYYAESTTDSNGTISTQVYSSTSGSKGDVAEFEDYTPNLAPEISMGSGNLGYAVFNTGENSKIFYTSGGKSFDFLCDARPITAVQ